MEDFVHLHLHTEYSLLDGAAQICKVVKTAKDMGMKSIAITDHGNMYGTIALFDECKKVGDIKPIFGCEFYVADDLHQKSGKPKLRHLILLVKNEEGYKNICMLNTIAFRDGYYYKPRIDYKTLKEYSNGLVCLCYQGYIPCGAVLDAHRSLVSGNYPPSAGQLYNEVVAAVAYCRSCFKYGSALRRSFKSFKASELCFIFGSIYKSALGIILCHF